MRLALLIAFGSGVLSGCVRRIPDDVMNQPAKCDSSPPPLAAGARAAPDIPSTTPSAGHGAVVGTVVQALTSNRISYSEVSLRPADSTKPVPPVVLVDSAHRPTHFLLPTPGHGDS